MPRKIDVELTSSQADGSFTWRAAGAKQPKGVVDGSLLYGGAKVGDVVRAEANFDIDGVVIVAVAPPPNARVERVARIEVVGTRRDEAGVTSQLAPKGRQDRGRDGDRRPRRDGEDRPRRDGAGRGERGPRPDGRPDARGDRKPRPDRGTRPERTDRPARPARDASSPRGAEGASRPAAVAKPRPKRLTPGSTHRDAMLATLSPEQTVVAEQLFRGGIPAVRAAIKTQNESRAEGAPEINAEPLIALAEELLPSVREAEWRDRAEAAKASLDEVGLRDLRAVVTASDAAARGDEARALAAELRDGLERRLEAQKQEWTGEITACLGDGRVVRALRLSARPPDPTAKLSGELLEQLTAAAGEAMAPDAPNDRWGTLLEAVVASPVRRTIQPAGLPEKPSPALLTQAKQAVGRVPALRPMLGVDMPPPPGKRTPPPDATTSAVSTPDATTSAVSTPDGTASAPTAPDPAPAQAGEPPAATEGRMEEAPAIAADGAPSIPADAEAPAVETGGTDPLSEVETEARNDEPGADPAAAAEASVEG